MDDFENDGNYHQIAYVVGVNLENRIAVLSDNAVVKVDGFFDYDSKPTDDLFSAAAFTLVHGDVQYVEYVEDFLPCTRH
jgi:hypothetical protein